MAMADFTIPANTYEDQPEDLQTVSLWNFAIAHADMPESLAYEITALAMENHDRMMTNHAAARETPLQCPSLHIIGRADTVVPPAASVSVQHPEILAFPTPDTGLQVMVPRRAFETYRQA